MTNPNLFKTIESLNKASLKQLESLGQIRYSIKYGNTRPGQSKGVYGTGHSGVYPSGCSTYHFISGRHKRLKRSRRFEKFSGNTP